MNILFFTRNIPYEQTGGIERTTITTIEGMTANGHNCYVLYCNKSGSEPMELLARKEFISFKENEGSNALLRCLIDNRIDVVIVQDFDKYLDELRHAIEQLGRPCKMLYAIHTSPDGYFKLVTLRYLLTKRKFHRLGLVTTAKMALFWPIWKQRRFQNFRKRYRRIARNCDGVILLSSKFESQFSNIAGSDIVKFYAIPNAVSFGEIQQGDNREKIVLVVSRLEESPKNISAILNIWKRIENKKLTNGYELHILGDGPDRAIYEKYAKKHLNNVIFHGQCNPEPLYAKAKILVSTSNTEGWPMTVLEAQQNGVVPIVYASFASVYDMIENERNGIIIPWARQSIFEKRLVEMLQPEYECQLARMSIHAMEDVQRFSKKNIAMQWEALLNQI